jgi:hypothetical protein
MGMSVGGGVAVLLPYFALDLGRGLGRRVDLVLHLESVLGVLHYPHVALRFAALDLGAWTLGTRLALHQSLFAIRTDHLNLTSTTYVSAEVALSGPITPATDLVLAVTGELDLLEHRVAEDEPDTRPRLAYDATILRTGIRTRLSEDLDGYLLARVRVPTETLRYEATGLYVVPFIEVGGTWTW